MMRRGHTAENYRRRVDAIKNSPRRIALTTDIIVGFPGETEDDFRASVDLVNFCRYDGAYIFKYSPRPGTPAAGLTDDVSASEKTARFLELEKTQRKNQAEVLSGYVGRSLKVLVEGPSNRSEFEMTGHSTCHKVVNFPGGKSLSGEIVDVRITQNKNNSLYGELAREVYVS
jgi:tRNA-2-methylthio-N6-dimethylallyladenosine synthase